MKTDLLKLAAVALFLLAPVGARAQGVVDGITDGAKNGDPWPDRWAQWSEASSAGWQAPSAACSGIDQHPAFRNYIANQHLPSDAYRASVAVGNQLPEEGIRYYDLPPKFGIRGYRYAVINDITVLVDPMTRKIVEVVN